MTNDPISDMLARIKNAIDREKRSITLPSSRMLESIAKVLENEGFINSYEVDINDDNPSLRNLTITLKYVNNQSAIEHLERVSRPGLRKYVGYKDIPSIKNKIGLAIVSTSKGIMSGQNAIQDKIGGEFLAKIW
jgi:small subunit ribosomal protein S8